MRRFVISAGACLVACAASWIAPCASAESPTNLTFSFWGSYKDLELWTAVAERFESDNPDVTLTLQYTPYQYGQKLRLQFISGAAADVLLMDDENFPAYGARGYLEDLGERIAAEEKALGLNDFFPTALEAFTFRGLTGALPWGGSTVLMFYNKDLFDAAGIPYPEDGWTWSDFRAISKTLTQDTDGDSRLDQFGNNMNFGFLDIEPVIWSFGGRILNADYTRAAVNSPEVLEALRFMQDLKFEDRSTIWFGDFQGLNIETQILTGKIGMTLSSWFSTQILNDVEEAMRWGVCPMPAGPRGDRYTRVTWDGISINAKISDEKKAAAWRFATYLLTEPVQRMIAEMGRGIPVRRAFAERYFVDPDSGVDERLAIDSMAYGRLTPITAKYLELKSKTQYWVKQLEQEYPADRPEPSEILAPLEADINAVLASELARSRSAGAPLPPRTRPYSMRFCLPL